MGICNSSDQKAEGSNPSGRTDKKLYTQEADTLVKTYEINLLIAADVAKQCFALPGVQNSLHINES